MSVCLGYGAVRFETFKFSMSLLSGPDLDKIWDRAEYVSRIGGL